MDLDPTWSTLARSIGYVFDHSLPPSSTVRELPPSAYTLSSQLHVSAMSEPVAFKTHFARQGWGFRTLNPDELGIAFGLSQWMRFGLDSGSAFPLPPVQGLIGWLGALIQSTHTVTTLPPIKPRAIATPATSTWFPDLSLALSHAWIDTDTVSDKAVKHDNADAPIQLWNNRILLLFPLAAKSLKVETEPMRTMCLQQWRGRLSREFRGYMSCTHGAN
jgi:hypothetical protein